MMIDTNISYSAPDTGEALWTIGEAGMLAAYDGWTSTPAAHVDMGLPAPHLEPPAPEGSSTARLT